MSSTVDMASSGEPDHRPRSSLDLVESAILDTIIPSSTDFDLEKALQSDNEHVISTPLSRIVQRQSLLFDETINVYVVLQTPLFDEDALRSYLARLVIILEAQIVGVKPDNYEGPPQYETIYSASVQEADKEDPFIIVQQMDEQNVHDDEGHIIVVWKLPVQLSRPQRLRPQNPTVTFFATASLRANSEVASEVEDDEYLPSQIPVGSNLFESFFNHNSRSMNSPHITSSSSSRISDISRVSKALLRPLKNNSRRTLRIFPAFTARVRYAKPNSTPSNPSVITSLDIDVTPYVGQDLTLEAVDMALVDGFVNDLNQSSLMSCPMRCYALDSITFLYQLSSSELANNKTNIKPIHISIKARVRVSDTCHPLITFSWTTSIDLSIPVNPGFAAPTTATTGRENRPSNLSISSSTFDTLPTLQTSKPDAPLNNELRSKQHTRTDSIPDFGVTITFTTSPEPPQLGKPFTWNIFVVNRSHRIRKLGLLVLPRHRRHATRTQNGHSNSTQQAILPKLDMAEAVMKETALHDFVQAMTIDPTELICLNADVRIGPLASDACHSLDIQFLPLKTGVLSVDCIRVFEIGTQEYVEIRELPTIVVKAENVT